VGKFALRIETDGRNKKCKRRDHALALRNDKRTDGKLRFLTRIAIYEIAQRVQRAGDRITMSARARASIKQSTKQKDGGVFLTATDAPVCDDERRVPAHGKIKKRTYAASVDHRTHRLSAPEWTT